MKNFKKMICLILLFTLVVDHIAIAQEKKLNPDEYITQFMKDLDLASVSVALVRDNEIVWKGAFGKANIKQDLNATTKQLNALGSVSKLFTGATLLKLYEEGKLSLDDDVNKYLHFSVRNPKYPNTPITFRMLLTHSSSIGGYQELQDSLYGTGDPSMSLSDVTTKFFDHNGEFYRPENFLDYKPGSSWKYSNWNFVLIGHIIEKITDKSFTDYCHEVLLKPLEMNTAGWFLREVDVDNIVTLYSKDDSGTKIERNPLYGWPGYSDGNLRTNVEEAANFLIMILNKGSFKGKQILKPETIDEMLHQQGVKNIPGGFIVDMGLVWQIAGENVIGIPNPIYLHGGEPTGTMINMVFNPETNSGFISCITGIKFSSPQDGAKLIPYFMNLLQNSATK